MDDEPLPLKFPLPRPLSRPFPLVGVGGVLGDGVGPWIGGGVGPDIGGGVGSGPIVDISKKSVI